MNVLCWIQRNGWFFIDKNRHRDKRLTLSLSVYLSFYFSEQLKTDSKSKSYQSMYRSCLLSFELYFNPGPHASERPRKRVYYADTSSKRDEQVTVIYGKHLSRLEQVPSDEVGQEDCFHSPTADSLVILQRRDKFV